jgi:glycosyltransferase involved in cell wall biosynthesis
LSLQKPAYICHITTAHPADDVRIFHKQVLALSKASILPVHYFACEPNPAQKDVTVHSLGRMPANRLSRFVLAQLRAIKVVFNFPSAMWHIHDPELLPVGILLALSGRTVIWDAHEDYLSQFSVEVNYRRYIPKWLNRPTNWMMRFLLKRIDKYCSGVICATDFIAKTYSNKNVVVVGNEANLDDFLLCQPKSNSRRILFTGATDESQCFEEIVRAIKEVSAVTLVVAGRHSKSNSLDWATKELGNRIEILGWLTRPQLASEISKSFLGFVTYNDSITNETNSPNKKFEFAAGGLPCVATPTKSNLEWADKCQGVYISKGYDQQSISKQIFRALENPSDWMTKSKSIRNWAKGYGNWAKSEETLIAFYQRLLERQSL